MTRGSTIFSGKLKTSGKRSNAMVLNNIQPRHTYASKLPGSFFKQAPMLIALMLFVWSMTVFRHSGFQPGIYNAFQHAACDHSLVDNAATSWDESMRFGIQHGRLSAVERGEGGVPRMLRELNLKPAGLDWEADMPSLTIFCSPKSYTTDPQDMQRRALLSWMALKPTPNVVLLGNDPSFIEVAKEFPTHVSVDPNVDANFLGVPQFHSIVARAQAADTDLSMIINSDIILLNDIISALQKVHKYFDNWVLTAARFDLGTDFPFSFEPSILKESGTTAAQLEQDIRKFTRVTGSLHTYGGVDFWAWNNSPVPLFKGFMPPFTFGRAKYDNWFTHEIVDAGLRQLVDASDAVTNVHVAHNYQHVGVTNSSAGLGFGKNFWSEKKKSSWELFSNIHLAEAHGSYTNQKGTALHAPWRLAACYEPQAGNLCLLKRARPSNCACEYSPYVQSTQSDPKLDKGVFTCGKVSLDRKKDFSIAAVTTPTSQPGLPHTMEQLLPHQAREVEGMRIVTLVAVTFGYAEMLMNFVCRLRHMGLEDNLVIAALDEDLYKFAFTQGLAVYYEHAGDNLRELDSKDCAFGSQCFRQFTKLKSRAVLKVLTAGYSVLWSDVDIVWFKDPLPDLLSYGEGTFPIQSNEPNNTLPGTGIRRINSGFYFARSDPMTIEGFSAVVAHAKTTKLSEQPSFYDILCGVKGELVVPHKEECQWTNGLRIIFLDRAKYPNGAVYGFWSKPNVTSACATKGCSILHNNWITGKDAKKDRLVVNGYWHYDVDRRMCMHDWHEKLAPIERDEEVIHSTDISVGGHGATGQ